MSSNLLRCWLEEVLDVQIDFKRLQNDHVTITNAIISLFKVYQLVDRSTQKTIQNAGTLEQKLFILRPHLKPFGLIDERTLTCVKCGSIERLKNILGQMYLTLGSNPCPRSKRWKNELEKGLKGDASKRVKGINVSQEIKANDLNGKSTFNKDSSCSWHPSKKCKTLSRNLDPSILLKQRRELEETYRNMRLRYDAIKKEEFQGLRKLFHSIYNTGVHLAIRSDHYKTFTGTKVPDTIVSEWSALFINGHEMYELPLYLTPEDIKCAKLIEIDEIKENIISDMHKKQYLCSQGPWKSPEKKMKLNASTGVDEVLHSLKVLTHEPILDIDFFQIRATIQTNMAENERRRFLKRLKPELEAMNIEIIEPRSFFEKTLAEVVVTDVISNICPTQEDDGVCELVDVVSGVNMPEAPNVEINPKLKRKSSIKSATTENEKSRKSVTISNSTHIGDVRLDQNQTKTHICQTPSGWLLSTNVASYLQLKSATLREDQRFAQLPLEVKVTFLVRYLQDLYLKRFRGLVLVDFPKTAEEVEIFEAILTGHVPPLIKYGFFEPEHRKKCALNSPRSFFTHYIRLKCYNELNNGLYCDEINMKLFQAIKEFYSSIGAYYTLEYYKIAQEELFCEISEMLKANNRIATKPRTNFGLNRCIRTQTLPERADVELQADLMICESEEQPPNDVDQYVEKSKNHLSNIFVEESVQKWKNVLLKHEDSISKALLTRSNVIRDNYCLQRYMEATFNHNLKETIDDSSTLEAFEAKFIQLDKFYRKDEEGKCFLYSLVDDLSNELTNSIQEKETRNLLLLKTVWNDPIIANMTTSLVNIFKRLLCCEEQRFIDVMRFITDLFSILLQQDITFNIPEINYPENLTLNLKKGSESDISSKHSVFEPSDHDNIAASSSFASQTNSVCEKESEMDHATFRMAQYMELTHIVQMKIETTCSMIEDVAQQIFSNSTNAGSSHSIKQPIPATTKTKRQRSSNKASIISIRTKEPIKRSRKRKSNLHTIPSIDSKSLSSTDSKKSRKSLKKKVSNTSVTSSSTYVMTDSNQDRSVKLKGQLQSCIHEQCEVTKQTLDKIKKTLEKDLKLLLLDNAEFLQDVDLRIKECKQVEVEQVESLVKKLSEAIETTWTSVEICKCNGSYFIQGTSFISPTPSFESLSSDKHLLNQLLDIKFLIDAFKAANSHSYHISYHKMIQILRTSLIKLCFEGSQLCSSMESVLNQLKPVSDNSFIVDWRDLILNLINIRQPSLEQLMHMKETFERKYAVKSFKWISLGNYCQIKLWFECAYESEVARELKGIYFELYKKGERSFWYEMFLMGLCKSEDPFEGFRMALQLFCGKRLNGSCDEGKGYLEVLTKEAKLKERIKQDVEELARNICCKILYSDEFVLDLNRDPSLPSISVPPRKSSIMITSLPVESCLEQRCEVPPKPKTPVERYLQLRKLHSCGCPTQEVDFDSSPETFDNGTEYFISKSMVLYVLEQAFPWHGSYKSDGYDLIETCGAICDEIFQRLERVLSFDHTKDPSIPVHMLFEHDFIRNWVKNGLTFTKLTLLNQN